MWGGRGVQWMRWAHNQFLDTSESRDVDWMIMRCIRNTDRHCDMNRHCDCVEHRSALRYWNVPGTALNVKVHEMQSATKLSFRAKLG